MTKEEQLLQEARIEAENVYPFKSDWSSHNNTIDFNQDRRLAYVQGYIANAKKQMSEAVQFAEYCMRNIYDIDFSKTTEEIYKLFKQQKQE